MNQPDETLHPGCGEIASLAARCRASGNYCAGGVLEHWFGEARRHGPKGETLFTTFASPWLMDQDRRCEDLSLSRAYSTEWRA